MAALRLLYSSSSAFDSIFIANHFTDQFRAYLISICIARGKIGISASAARGNHAVALTGFIRAAPKLMMTLHRRGRYHRSHARRFYCALI